MCGVVDGGIVDGLWGYEAGQSGVGDIFGWFTSNGVPPEYHQAAAKRRAWASTNTSPNSPPRQAIGEHGLIALDWHSGNRSVLVDHELSGVVVGQTLATRPEDTYRALLEATAFGTRTIVDAFRDSGVPVREFIVAGGLLKNKLLMQIYADVTGLPLSTIGSTQGPALGSAIHAAVAAGEYPDIRAAAAAMGSEPGRRLHSDPGKRCRLRGTLPGVPDPARLLRQGSQRGHAPAQGDPAQGRPRRCCPPRPSRRRSAGMSACWKPSPGVRREVCALHAELTRYELVVWTAGNVSARVPGHDLMVIKPSGVSYDELTPWSSWWSRTCYGTPSPPPRRATPRRMAEPGPVAVVGHRGACLRLPAHAGGRRRGAHPFDLRHGLGRAGRGDPLRADHDG